MAGSTELIFNEGEQQLIRDLLTDVTEFKKRKKTNVVIARGLVWYRENVFEKDADIKIDFLKRIMDLGKPAAEIPESELIEIPETHYFKNGEERIVWPQFLRKEVYGDFIKMNEALGGRLIIQSGYRSPTYQAVIFFKNLEENGWNFEETSSLVAFPGVSQHGSAEVAAVDLTNLDGVGDTQNTMEFKKTSEFRWLQKYAAKYNFTMPFYRGNQKGIAEEPWHWMWRKPVATQS